MDPYDKDIDELKEEMIDYYGTAMTNGFPAAMADLNELEFMDEEEIRELAKDLGLNDQ